MKDYYSMSSQETLVALGSRASGLTEQEVRSRQYGQDIQVKKNNFFALFLQQFKDLMILILLVAAFVSIVIGCVEGQSSEIIDGVIILAIVLMNACFGFAQEIKAERSLEALKKMTQPEVGVLRDGKIKKISTQKLVVGDIVLLEAGTIVPADLRLIESSGLQIDESSLTGESEPSNKNSQSTLREDTSVADMINLAFRGSVVLKGHGFGVVTALGKDTKLGKIAQTISTTEKELTPLQKSIKSVAKLLTFLVLAIAFVTFLLELFARPGEPMQAFLTAVAISVAAIPESMPAVITIIMSLGVARLAKQKAVVRRMHSVETLGCCDVICSDKTGTITQNKMSVTAVYVDGTMQKGRIAKTVSFDTFLEAMLLCNDTYFADGKYVGDPTEVALSNLGKKFAFDKEKLCDLYPRQKEMPFDSRRKLMSVLCGAGSQKVIYSKGAVDSLLSKCDRIMEKGCVTALTQVERDKIMRANSDMAEGALRVLAVAFAPLEERQFKEEGLIFLGLVGMIDPPRKEIKQAVKKCKRAGMKPVMITGDHKATALAIAKEIGIASSQKQVLTGRELDQMSDSELGEVIENITVFARVSPEDKVRIVNAFKARSHVVAMTGDGVNDAPSLKAASIGIGMGIAGTDVTKEVADLIVTDDNFATIVVAVEEGRKIYQNIQKAVKFLFSANMGELLSLFVATLIFPQYVFLYPVQILFVNLITDSLPAIALGLENPEINLMSQAPRAKNKGLFSDGVGWSIVILGLVQTALTIVSFVIGLKAGGEDVGVSMAFYTLNIVQMFYLASMRTNGSMFSAKFFTNKMFFVAIGFSFGLLALIALTPLSDALSLAPLSFELWLVIFALSLVMMLSSELFKLCYRLFRKKKSAF